MKDLPPIHKSHPQTTPPETVEKIRALALKHPAYGCTRHEAMLALEGIPVSSITIQKILHDLGLGTKIDRWLALEAQNAEKAIEITSEQAAFLEKMNPCFRERHVESSAPGELLSADTFFVGSLKGVGKVYLHAVVDTYGSYAFGFLHVSKQPEAAVAVLHNDVLPFYRNLDLPVKAVLTDNGREFCGTERHPYELWPATTSRGCARPCPARSSASSTPPRRSTSTPARSTVRAGSRSGWRRTGRRSRRG